MNQVQNNPRPVEQPEEQPTPQEQPKRKRYLQPTFGKVVAAGAILLALGAQAQTTPQRPADQRPAGTMDSPPPRLDKEVADPASQQNSAWQRFDDRTGAELELDDTQMDRLREIDERYQKEYDAVGMDAVNDPAYIELNGRRDAEVRAVLTPEQYARWNTRNTTTDPIDPNDR